MKVFILTEAGGKIGFGHLSRCTAIYHAFVKNGIKPTVIVNGDEGISSFLKGMSYQILDWLKDFQELLSRISGADIVCVDSYLADKTQYDEIDSLVSLIVCMDDYKRIRYPAGVVINGLMYARQMNYPSISGIKYLLGADYAIVRKAFWRPPPKRILQEIKEILVTFGGSDFLNLASQTLAMLTDQFPRWKKTLVVSRFDQHLSLLQKLSDKKTTIVVDATDQEMKKIMVRCDVAISASGQTLSELALMGVPGVAVCVAKNQRRNWNAWTKQGFMASQPHAHDMGRTLRNLISPQIREGISKRLVHCMAADGVLRIVDKLIAALNDNKERRINETKRLRIRAVVPSDCRDIWLWRNSWQARKASFQSQAISYASHEIWFKQKIKDSHSVLFIAQAGRNKCGCVRYEVNGKQAVISILLNPRFYGMGLGARLIRLADQSVSKKIKDLKIIRAEIQSFHSASKKAFKAAGYRRKEQMVKNSKRAEVYQYSFGNN